MFNCKGTKLELIFCIAPAKLYFCPKMGIEILYD